MGGALSHPGIHACPGERSVGAHDDDVRCLLGRHHGDPDGGEHLREITRRTPVVDRAAEDRHRATTSLGLLVVDEQVRLAQPTHDPGPGGLGEVG